MARLNLTLDDEDFTTLRAIGVSEYVRSVGSMAAILLRREIAAWRRENGPAIAQGVIQTNCQAIMERKGVVRESTGSANSARPDGSRPAAATQPTRKRKGKNQGRRKNVS